MDGNSFRFPALRRAFWAVGSGSWLEPQLVLLLLVAGLGFGARLGSLPLRGEESRRARIAIEMIERGDFVVPRQQGEPFLSRPPLQNWLIALAGLARGEVDVWAIRGPSALAMLLVTALLYAYCRTWLTPTGSLIAGLAFATSGQVLELGRLGETEALFTLCVSGSLLLWHLGRTLGWPSLATWSLAWLAVAAGTLVKGPQAPVYFLACTSLFLLLTRQGRDLLAWQPLAALAVAAATVATWQVPFWSELGMDGVWRIYASDVGLRFADLRWLTIVGHLVTYPLEILACLLPWSVLLAVYLRPRWRQRLGPWPPQVVFLLVCLAVTFPSCWLVPGARGRYYMPLYPCFAPLIGWVVDQSWQQANLPVVARPWPRFVRVAALLVAAASTAVLAISLLAPDAAPAQTPAMASLYLLAGWAVAGLMWWSAGRQAAWRVEWSASALAGFLILSHVGVAANAYLRKAEDTAAAVAKLNGELNGLPGLVSFGPVHHLFAYYFGRSIPLRPWPQSGDELPADLEYFCFETMPGVPTAQIPFAWHPVAVVSCERNRKQSPQMTVVVGRRLAPSVATQVDESPAQARLR